MPDQIFIDHLRKIEIRDELNKQHTQLSRKSTHLPLLMMEKFRNPDVIRRRSPTIKATVNRLGKAKQFHASFVKRQICLNASTRVIRLTSASRKSNGRRSLVETLLISKKP